MIPVQCAAASNALSLHYPPPPPLPQTAVHDLVSESMTRQYPRIAQHARITILEAEPSVLSDFDATLSQFAASRCVT